MRSFQWLPCARFAALSAGLAFSMSGPVRAHGIDLDTLSVQDLDKYLTIELNEVFTRDPHAYKRNQAYPLQAMKEAILEALSDDGDDEGDEGVIDEEELEAEMAEIGSTLEAEVGKALAIADRLASQALSGMVKVAYGDIDIAREGMVRAQFAVDQTKKLIIGDIKAK